MQTLADIEKLPKNMLSLAEVCDYLGSDRHVVGQTIRNDKKRGTNSMCFPTMIIGNRIKIPREAFVAAMKGKQSAN